MKNFTNHYFIIVMLLTLPILTFSQAVEFAYDASGNRIERTLTLNKNSVNVDSTMISYSTVINNVNLKIVPNPNGGRFTVELESDAEMIKASLFLYSSKGALIYKKENVSQISSIDISNHENGTYLLKIEVNRVVETWKIIKQ